MYMRKAQVFGVISVALAVLFFGQSGFAQVENGYITSFRGDSLTVINTAINSVTDRIPVGEGPVGIAVNSSCTTAYVANFDGSSISVINLRDNGIIRTITSPDIISPSELVLSPDGSRLYVEGSNEVVVINTTTSNVITTIPLTDSPQTLAITLDGSKLFVAGENEYFAIETATNTIIDTVNIPAPFNDTQHFTLSPDGQRLFLTNRLATISGIAGIIISTETNQVLGNMAGIPDPVAATFLGFVPNSNKAYLSGGNTTGNDLMQIYDPNANVFTGSFFVGPRATDMGFLQDGSRAYVILGGFSDDVSAVSIVNTATDQVVDTINLPTIDSPTRIAMCLQQPSSIPTLSQWGLIAMAGLLGIVGFMVLRRKKLAA